MGVKICFVNLECSNFCDIHSPFNKHMCDILQAKQSFVLHTSWVIRKIVSHKHLLPNQPGFTSIILSIIHHVYFIVHFSYGLPACLGRVLLLLVDLLTLSYQQTLYRTIVLPTSRLLCGPSACRHKLSLCIRGTVTVPRTGRYWYSNVKETRQFADSRFFDKLTEKRLQP